MNAFTSEKLIRLNGLLSTLKNNSSISIKSKEFKSHFTEEEFQDYKIMLADNKTCSTHSLGGDLPLDAKEYWEEFKTLYMGARRLRNLHEKPGGHTNKSERQRINDAASALMENFEELSPQAKSWFRPSENTDSAWPDPYDLLEEEFQVLMSRDEREGRRGNVVNFTQRQFLHDVIYKLNPPPPVPDDTLQRAQRFLEQYRKRHR